MQTLQILWDARIIADNIERNFSCVKGRYTILDDMLFRRDENKRWAWLCKQEPDDDPAEIYQFCKRWIKDVFKRSTGKRASFHYNGEHWILVAKEDEGEDDDTATESEWEEIESDEDMDDDNLIMSDDVPSNSNEDRRSDYGGDQEQDSNDDKKVKGAEEEKGEEWLGALESLSVYTLISPNSGVLL